MTALWGPQQREWLQARGHDVLVMAGAAIEAPPATAESLVAASAGGHPVPAPPRPATAAAGDSPLRLALPRAAGRRDLGEIAWLPDPDTLRGNAAAKRALWPRLRTLRKPTGDA